MEPLGRSKLISTPSLASNGDLGKKQTDISSLSGLQWSSWEEANWYQLPPWLPMEILGRSKLISTPSLACNGALGKKQTDINSLPGFQWSSWEEANWYQLPLWLAMELLGRSKLISTPSLACNGALGKKQSDINSLPGYQWSSWEEANWYQLPPWLPMEILGRSKVILTPSLATNGALGKKQTDINSLPGFQWRSWEEANWYQLPPWLAMELLEWYKVKLTLSLAGNII